MKKGTYIIITGLIFLSGITIGFSQDKQTLSIYAIAVQGF
jgi:hypothetical protein